MAIRRRGRRADPPGRGPWRATLRLSFVPTEAYEEWSAKMIALVEGDAFDQLLRRAAAEVLLDAYRRRFAEKIPQIINTQRFEKAGGRRTRVELTDDVQPGAYADEGAPARTAGARITNNLRAASAKLSKAQMAGNYEMAIRARRELRAAQKAMSKALDRPKEAGRLGPGNVFRPAVYKLMALFTQAGYMGIRKGEGVGIGPRRKVMALETPSATKHLTGMDTASDMTSLFRQVEFGTGVYGTDPEGNSTALYEYDRGWIYGKDPHQGLRIKGVQPAHVLWQEAKAPWGPDRVRLHDELVRIIQDYLN